MNDFVFQSPEWLYGLFVWAAVVIACLLGAQQSAKAARALGLHPASARLSIAFFGAGLLLILLALARPGWNPQPRMIAESGRDVIVVLDVSRSMLAEDRAPNRLENIRATLSSFIDALPSGNRVALVFFAGSSSIVAPPTTDRQFLQKALADAGPESVAFGGTRIGDALRKVADSLLVDSSRHGFQDILLLTDGEDHASDPEEAIDLLNEAGASLLILGLGDSANGHPIPLGNGQHLTHNDEIVLTRQNPGYLQPLANRAEAGLFLNAGTREVDVTDVYARFVEHRIGTATREADFAAYSDRSFGFLSIAFLCLVLSAWLLRRQRRRELTGALVTLLLLAALSTPARVEAAQPGAAEAFGSALEAAERGDWESARRNFEAAAARAQSGPAHAAALANKGTVLLREQLALQDSADAPPAAEQVRVFAEATDLLEGALALQPELSAAARNLEIARFRQQRAQQALERQLEEDDESESALMPGEEGEPSGETGWDEEDWDLEDALDAGEPGDAASAPGEDSLTDLLNQDVLPPTQSPQDILNQEIKNNRERLKPRRPQQTGVEKDW